MTRKFLQYLVLAVLIFTVGTPDLQARRFRQLPDSSLTALRAAGRTPLRDTSLRSTGDSSLRSMADSSFAAVLDSSLIASRDSLHRADSIKAISVTANA